MRSARNTLNTMFALFLAVLLVAPSVYGGIMPPQKAHALDITGLAAPVAATATCSLGGWLSNAISNLGIPWLQPSVQQIPGTANVTNNTITAGTVVPAATAPVPITVQAQATLGTAAASTIAVPTSDIYLQQQNYQMSQSLVMIQRNTQQQASMAVSTAAQTGTITFKECVLDPLAWMVKEVLIRTITDDILDWIEGGFEGTPAFLSNPSEFFRDMADEVVNAYLYQSGLDQFLCEPFRIDLIFNFEFEYNRPKWTDLGKLSCSLDDIFPGVNINIDTDGDGIPDTTVQGPDDVTGYNQVVRQGRIDFVGGGLSSVGEILKPSNNTYGQHFALNEETSKTIAESSSESSMELNFGKGWFAQKCGVDAAGDPITCTPGDFIAKQMDDWTGGALGQLEIADEFAEILNALFAALFREILDSVSSDTGLLRISQ